MNLRLPEELDAKLEAIARARHTSKHALLIEAATRFADDNARRSQVNAAVDSVLERDSELLERLEDA